MKLKLLALLPCLLSIATLASTSPVDVTKPIEKGSIQERTYFFELAKDLATSLPLESRPADFSE